MIEEAKAAMTLKQQKATQLMNLLIERTICKH
jgi:hypothetical protein